MKNLDGGFLFLLIYFFYLLINLKTKLICLFISILSSQNKLKQVKIIVFITSSYTCILYSIKFKLVFV